MKKRTPSFISTALGLLTKPLTREELKARATKNGRLNVNIAVGLDKLITFDQGIDDLNNLADEMILEEGSLSDISYRVIGGSQTDEDLTVAGSVFINVDADVSDIIEED